LWRNWRARWPIKSDATMSAKLVALVASKPASVDSLKQTILRR